MYPPVDTKNPAAVAAEVQSASLKMYPDGDPTFVSRAFAWASECFVGGYGDYQPIDALYHDFEHTLQGTLCFARLLLGRHVAKAEPVLPQRIFELGLLAILLHDTGYLKKRGDNQGTGAKYTATHVHRSAEFAGLLLGSKNFSADDIAAVQNMIRCTGIDADMHRIPFRNELEKIVGQALATADLLGQMSADDYVSKLPVLYAEFAEAARYDRGHTDFIAKYGCAEDLVQRTPAFWRDYVLPRLNREFGRMHQFLENPYPGGPNWYVQRIEANMRSINGKQAAHSEQKRAT